MVIIENSPHTLAKCRSEFNSCRDLCEAIVAFVAYNKRHWEERCENTIFIVEMSESPDSLGCASMTIAYKPKWITLEQVRDILVEYDKENVADIHVVWQTLDDASSYSGARKFSSAYDALNTKKY